MLRKRRKAVRYLEINSIRDANDEYIVKGSYIKKKKENTIDGPITKILEEITENGHQSIKYLVYVKNTLYLLGEIELTKKILD